MRVIAIIGRAIVGSLKTIAGSKFRLFILALWHSSHSLFLFHFNLIINYIISEARLSLVEDARPPTKLLLLNTPASLGASNWNNIL